jgi:hypothetical protein
MWKVCVSHMYLQVMRRVFEWLMVAASDGVSRYEAVSR